MAGNTYNIAGQIIQFTFDGSPNDLDLGALFPVGLKIAAVGFIASANTDVFVLKDKSATGNILAEIIGTGSAEYPSMCGFNCYPYLDISACTLDTPANCKAMIYFI